MRKLLLSASLLALASGAYGQAVIPGGGGGSGSGITALTSDVTATGPGSVAATVNSYNGGTAFGTAAAINLGANVGTAMASALNGSGALTATTSPVFVTPALGTPTSGVATNLTGTAAGLTAGNVTTNANLTGVITSSGNATSIASQTGTGTKFVVDTSPTLVTPTLGVASATTLNKWTFTTPATGITLTGTDGQTYTLPTTTATIARTDAANTFTGTQTFSGSIVGQGGLTITGGGVNLNTTSNNAVSIASTSTNNSAITIGNSSHTGLTTLAGLATGTNADFLCLSSGNVVLLQTSACTISSLRFKEAVAPMEKPALPIIRRLAVDSFRLKETVPANRDPNARSTQYGLIAENIAKVVPECAIYETDMKTPKSYRQECVIALLVKGMQEQQMEIQELRNARK